MHPDIAAKTDKIAEICRTYGVVRLELFGSGSRFMLDFDPESSDFDFLVEYDPTARRTLQYVIGFRTALAKLFGRKVDVLPVGVNRNKWFQASIDRDRVTVYEA
ncbi:MAG: nucleotidyltransferase domain-containing protein [Rhodobacteraceae bacterium]|nr:nucleotidyltransferase domain-containing protein [Paracoccaceae bacterium]